MALGDIHLHFAWQAWHLVTLTFHFFHTQLCHTLLFTHNFVTHSLSHTTLSHTIFHKQLCHTHTRYLSHTTFSHATLSHTIFHTHTTLSHTTLSHTLFHTQLLSQITNNFVTHTIFHTQLCHTQLCHTQLCHTPSFAHNLSHTLFHTHYLSHTPSFTHSFVTHSLSHTTSFTNHKQLFHTHPLTRNFVTHHLSHTTLSHIHTGLCHTITLRGRRGTWKHPPSLCVAGVALGDIHLRFASQAWHLATSTFTLCGRRGTCGTGLALVARLGALVRRRRRGTFSVAGVALVDIHLRFTWQAWHLVTSTFISRGRRGTW